MRSSARLKRLQVDGATSYAMRRHVGLEPAHLLLHHLAHLCDCVVARPRCALHLLHGEGNAQREAELTVRRTAARGARSSTDLVQPLEHCADLLVHVLLHGRLGRLHESVTVRALGRHELSASNVPPQ